MRVDSAERGARAARLRAGGLAVSGIARRLGVSRQTVYADLARWDAGHPASEVAAADSVAAEIARAIRNGLPLIPYRWRARRYRWAERALERAEAIHGRPA